MPHPPHPGEGCQSPLSRCPPRAPCPSSSGASRDEGGPFTTWPSLSCPYETHTQLTLGGLDPPVSMQVPTLPSSVGGGLPEAGAAQLGSMGCSASGRTHKFVLNRGAGLTPSLSHLTGPNPSQGSSCPLPGSPRGGSCKTRGLRLKSEGLPQTGLFPEREGCSA